MSGHENQSLAVCASVASAMHELAAAIRRRERDSFERAFNRMLRAFPVLRAAWLKLMERVGPPAEIAFGPTELSFPVSVERGMVGTLHRPLDRGQVGEVEIRLLAATADLVGSVLGLDHAEPGSGDAVRVLQVALDQLPVAVVCLGREGGMLCCNARAALLAGGSGGPAALVELFGGAFRTGGSRAQLVSLGGRTAVASICAAPPASAAFCSAVVTLVDVSERVGAYRLEIEREMFRALWLAQPLSLAVFKAPGRFAELVALAEERVATLPGFSGCGLVDSSAYGALFRGRTAREVRNSLANLDRRRELPGLRVGLAQLRREAATVDALVATALASVRETSWLPRPRVLLWDSSASVTEALRVALREDCEAISCHEREECLHLLRLERADAVFAKVDVDEWEEDIDLVRRIVAQHPDVVPFVLTDLPGPYQQLRDAVGAPLDVFRKPFSVQEVRAAVATRLSV